MIPRIHPNKCLFKYKIFRRCLISRYIKKVDSRVKNCYCQKKNQKSVFICNFYTYAIFVTWNILEISCPIRYTYSAKKYGAHSSIDFAAHWARATSRDARRGREGSIYWLPWRHRGDSIPLHFYPHKFHCDKFWRYRCGYAYCGMKYLFWFFLRRNRNPLFTAIYVALQRVTLLCPRDKLLFDQTTNMLSQFRWFVLTLKLKPMIYAFNNINLFLCPTAAGWVSSQSNIRMVWALAIAHHTGRWPSATFNGYINSWYGMSRKVGVWVHGFLLLFTNMYNV